MKYPAGDGTPHVRNKSDIRIHYNNSGGEKQTISAKRLETEELR